MVFDEFIFPEFADHSSLTHLGFLGFRASSFWYSPTKEFSNCDQEHAEPPPQEAGFIFEQNTQERKSFAIDGSHENYVLSDDNNASFRNAEEQMDLLWEDFNDELGRASFIEEDAVALNVAFSHTMLGYRFDAISPLKMSKRRNSINRQRRLSLRIILKVLRKLLLLGRSRCPKARDF